jgi:hypothetical protein
MAKWIQTPEEIDGKKVKPKGYKQGYTRGQIKEILKCSKDPIYFIEKYVKLKHPKHGALPFKLYEFQRRLIQTYMDNTRCISMLSRQCGKTATAAAYLLWKAMFNKDYTIFIASKDQGGADEIMERLWFAYEELPWFLKPGTTKNDVKTKTFDNGSKVMTSATTKTSGRGKSPSLVYLDEFAFVPPNVAEEFWVSIFAALSTGGDCIITSTPNNDEDKFAQLWFNAAESPLSDVWEDKLAKRYAVNDEQVEPYETIYENELIEEKMRLLTNAVSEEDDDDEEELTFVKFHAHWSSVPDKLNKKGEILKYRGAAFKNVQLRSGLSPEKWMREYECCFITGDNTLISGAKLASFRNTIRDPRFVDKWGTRWYEQIRPNTPYAVVMDPSGDGQGDDCAIQVWELPSMIQVAEWNDNEADQDEQARMLRRVLTKIDSLQNNDPNHGGANDIYYSVERNSIGIGIIRIIERVGEEKFPGWLIDGSEISMSTRGESTRGGGISAHRGLVTTNSSKRRYAQEFKQFIERNLFTVRSKFLSSQLKNFVRTGPSWAAKEGTKDDLVMSCVLMCHLIDELRDQEPDLDDYVKVHIEEDYDQDDLTHADNIPMLPIL